MFKPPSPPSFSPIAPSTIPHLTLKMPWDPDVDWSAIKLLGYWPDRKRINLQDYLDMRHEIHRTGLMKPIDIADLIPSRGFARGNTKSNQNLKASYNNGSAGSPTSQQPPMPPLSNSSSLQTFTQEGPPPETGFEQPKRFLSDKYAKCSVKGNFLTLAAQPKNVELGEWLAHQRGSSTTTLQLHTKSISG